MKITGLWAEMVDETTADLRLEPISLDEAQEWISAKREQSKILPDYLQTVTLEKEGHTHDCACHQVFDGNACRCKPRL